MHEVIRMENETAPSESVIHVLHLRDTVRICGPGKTILETIRNNRDPDIRYSVGAFGSFDGNLFLQEASNLCETFRLPGNRTLMPLAALELARWIHRHGVSIVHAHDFKTDAVTILASALSHTVPITTVHGFIVLGPKSRIYAKAHLSLLRRMKRVFVVSDATRQFLLRQSIDDRNIDIVRNSIVLDAYPFGYRSEALKAGSGLQASDLVIGCIGRLSEEKGQRVLLEAFPKVLERVPAARLAFAGDGPDERYLRDRVTALGLEPVVHFLGHRNEIREVFGGLDLLVLSSFTEGLPNVVLEAMALGVPVVATAVGGTPELVRNGETGWLVPSGDAEALATAISDALRRRGDAKDRAMAARRHVEAKFDMSMLIHRTHAIYRDMLASRARKTAEVETASPGGSEGPRA
ncbi:MAG TPA: glycosyltransferase family 4 protein [Candidatus Polarisedimenticolaceae bacterium]|nr:glycosyltransferase family 4 protein [Candidatus Polarisedimenticolaceae bacterium]